MSEKRNEGFNASYHHYRTCTIQMTKMKSCDAVAMSTFFFCSRLLLIYLRQRAPCHRLPTSWGILLQRPSSYDLIFWRVISVGNRHRIKQKPMKTGPSVAFDCSYRNRQFLGRFLHVRCNAFLVCSSGYTRCCGSPISSFAIVCLRTAINYTTRQRSYVVQIKSTLCITVRDVYAGITFQDW